MTGHDEQTEAWFPDTGLVRERYIGSVGGPPRVRRAQNRLGKEFDRWLAAQRAEWERAAMERVIYWAHSAAESKKERILADEMQIEFLS